MDHTNKDRDIFRPFSSGVKVGSVYAHSNSTSGAVTAKEMKDAVKRARAEVRDGLGYRSRILFTHPDNYKELAALLEQVKSTDYTFVRPYRIVTNECLDKTRVVREEYKWNDEKYINYSDGPASDMTDEEYMDMCEYFGWVEKIKIEEPVWYELNADTFSDVFRHQLMAKVIDEQKKKIDDMMVRHHMDFGLYQPAPAYKFNTEV